MAKTTDVGSRLIEAFGTDDKAFIAEKLGFSSIQSIYKILKGEGELNFERLRLFQNYTKHSIDWLLTGEGPKVLDGYREFDIERSIERHDSWRGVMDDWFAYEGREMPETMGASFMGGWESFDREQRIAALKDFKMLLDRIADGKA